MSDEGQAMGVAVVGDENGPETAAVEQLLRQWNGCNARWYARRDLNRVDAAVRGDHVRCVVFTDVDDLLEEVWEGEVEIDRWLAKGVRVEFARGLGADASAHVESVLRSWRRWNRRRRRRHVVAAVVLSVMALVAAFTLSWATA
ncbi:MAG: hypothetical protein JSU68_04505 [Phycisphaerales bacterium]|nr:MAG: hypothetical protein JSU68_04505 [Phycisphaerales bacterium]